jgi:hypothetical protein
MIIDAGHALRLSAGAGEYYNRLGPESPQLRKNLSFRTSIQKRPVTDYRTT